MATADTNTNHYLDSHPTADIYFSDMSAALVDINFNDMESINCQFLIHSCDEARAGLYHCLSFLGDVLTKEHAEELSPANLHQIGHTLSSISQLVPTLTDLSSYLKMDLIKRGVMC